MNERTPLPHKLEITCADMERFAALYVWDELEPEPRAAVEEHVAACIACAARLAEERDFSLLAAQRQLQEPSVTLLAQCRSEFSDALDQQESSGIVARLRNLMRPKRWFSLHPALSAAGCIVAGLLVGTALPSLLRSPESPATPPSAAAPQPRAALPVSLEAAQISGISVIPTSDPQQPGVEVRYVAERPEVVRGSLDDVEVRRMLVQVMQDTSRFHSGLRMDSLDLLRSRADFSDVRQALCEVARSDKNPAVRMKALEALRGYGQDERVRRTLMDALQRDDNPGARMEAIRALAGLLEDPESPDQAEVLKVLQDRVNHDPNNGIRLESAAAIRQVGARARY